MGRMREGQCIVVNACADVFAIPLRPREADRGANKRGCKAERYHRSKLNVYDDPYDLSKTFFREDLQEEEQE